MTTMTTHALPALPRFNRTLRVLMTSALAASTLLLGAGCSTTSPDVVNRNEAQRLAQVQDGVLLNVRAVVVEGNQSGVGGVSGAVVGGIAGSSVGGRREGAAVGVLAAVAGAAIGNAVERFGTREEALELLVQLPNGERRSIVQAKGNENFVPGAPVLLVTSGGKTRVMLAPPVSSGAATVAPAAPAPAR